MYGLGVRVRLGVRVLRVRWLGCMCLGLGFGG